MLRAAGRIAMKHFTRAAVTWKADRTMVTEADVAVQSFLVEMIVDHFPDDGIIAEENGVRRDSVSGRFWTIDPIDGTVPFVSGLPTWSIGVGLLDGGSPRDGFIYLPTSRELFHTEAGGPVCRGQQPRHLKSSSILRKDTVLFTPTHRHQYYHLAPTFPGWVFSLGSASVHLAHVATGGADAVLIGHDKIWDLAPGLAMLEAAGGVLQYLDGTPVTMEALMDGSPAPQHMIGGNEKIVQHVRKHVGEKVGSRDFDQDG